MRSVGVQERLVFVPFTRFRGITYLQKDFINKNYNRIYSIGLLRWLPVSLLLFLFPVCLSVESDKNVSESKSPHFENKEFESREANSIMMRLYIVITKNKMCIHSS